LSRYGSKTVIVLNIKKDEAVAALVELRKEWADADIALGAFIMRLQWFRSWRAYKHFGHSTFEQFLNAEVGHSRKWLYRHLKTLPIEADERRLLEVCDFTQSGTPCPNLGEPNRVSDSAKADCGNIGNCNGDGLKLTHKQRLEIADAPIDRRQKALEAVMAECPGADLEATRAVIEKTIGPKKPKTAKKKTKDAPDAGELYRETMLQLSKQFSKQADGKNADVAKSGASVIGSAIQTLRVLAKAIKGYMPGDCPF
jgi:hypothetical protein